MVAVFVHGVPETSVLWDGVRARLDGDSVAVRLPGFGNPRPDDFNATKDAYAEWLVGELSQLDGPIDLVGHDWGALLVLRVATAFPPVALRSWVVDVADIFHPDFRWHPRAQLLQTPGAGEQAMKSSRAAPPESPDSFASRLAAAGVPAGQAGAMAAAHDETMSQCILDLYRSAVPNVAADWWADVTGPTRPAGLVLLLPDPPEDEARSLEVAHRLGAGTERMGDLEHCWMAEDPAGTAAMLRRFWATVGGGRRV
jgi:pimeloyl-ACP methyl ester carboxylesterase